MSWVVAALLLTGLVGLPAWLLTIGHRLRDRGRRTRGAFWGGVAGHLLADALFLTLLLDPPLTWPPAGGPWAVVAVLLVPPVLGAAVGAAIGKEGPVRRF